MGSVFLGHPVIDAVQLTWFDFNAFYSKSHMMCFSSAMILLCCYMHEKNVTLDIPGLFVYLYHKV